MFKVEDANGSHVLINPLQISYIKEKKKSIEIVLAGMDPRGDITFLGVGEIPKSAKIVVDAGNRNPRQVMAEWENQLDKWYSDTM